MKANVAVLTVTYGNRFAYLTQVVEQTMKDPRVGACVIVDNASTNGLQIRTLAEAYPGRITVLREEENTGSAGGFSLGLAHVRTLDAEHVLLLDDDNVPEDDFLSFFFDALATFEQRNVVLSGNRVDIMPKDSVFTRQAPRDSKPETTFFNVFDFRKLAGYAGRLVGLKTEEKRVPFQPIIPSRGFVYGGALLPMEAVRKAPLPDPALVLYGDDLAYSWGVHDAGFESYVCARPIIRDVDMTFAEGDHIVGLFDPKTPVFKVYFRIRNMVRISRRHSTQPAIVLFLSICAWICGLFIFALAQGLVREYGRRASLVIRAAYDGYNEHAKVPGDAKLP